MKVKSRSRQPYEKVKQRSGAHPWSEAVFREITDNIIDGVYCIDTDGYFISMNKVLSQRTGIQEEQIPHLHFLDLIDPAYHDRAKDNFQRAMEGKEGIPYELRHKSDDGTVRIVEVHSRPVFAQGKVVGIIGISRDVTERKLAVETLQRQEEYYRSLIENVSDMIVVINSDNIINYVSPSVERLLGYKNEEVIGVNAFHFIHPDEINFTMDELQNIIKSSSHSSVEHRMRHSDGSWRIVESVGKVFHGNDEAVYVILSSRDITDRKAIEKALKASEINLSRLVKEKTAQFIEKNKEMAMEIDDLKRNEVSLKRRIRELRFALKTHLRSAEVSAFDESS